MSESTITTLDDASKPAVQAEAKVTKKAAVVKGANSVEGLSGKRVTITISVESGETGGEAVPVGLNGVLYQIPRGEPQNVPVEVLGVLRNAKTTHMHVGAGGAIVERTVPRYSIQIGDIEE